MRIATWNVNSLRVRMEHLGRWLAENAVDAIALQELKLADEHFPRADFEALGLHAACYGQKTYNGVAIVSRREAADVALGMPADADPQRRVIAATVGPIRLVNVYVPNGQAVGSEKYTYKLAWLERLRAYLAALLATHEHLLVVGDFNIAPEDRDVHDPAAWEGSVHVSAPEREALARIAALGLTDLFRRFEQPKNALELVGLPHERVPPRPRPAHRPDARLEGARRALHRLHHRPRSADLGAAVRPRPGHGHI